MKKTLVAVAALALAGGAFAQSSVTVSGKFAAAYMARNDGLGAATSKSNGFEVTDGNVTFAASEDLGGGMKAGVSMDVRVRGRGPAGVVNGRDASIYLSGGFGEIRMGAVDAIYNTLLDLSVPLQGVGLDTGNTINGGDGNVDMFSYTTPSMGGFTGNVMLLDSISAPGAGGMQSTSANRDAVQLGLAYSNGPVNAGFEYTSFGANASVGLAKSRYRLSGNYNLGVATIGLGFGSEKYAAVTSKETAMGVSVPMGALNLGFGYVRATNQGGVAKPTRSGWEAVADYSLSKRTSVQVSYLSEDINAVNNSTIFRTRLMHKF